MTVAAAFDPDAIEALAELGPLLRRAVDLNPAGVARIRVQPGDATALVPLPFGVLVGRRISGRFGTVHDGTYRVDELLDWLEAADRDPSPPTRHDGRWHGALPPESGWRRVDTVPDDVIRGLVRQGALTLKEAAEREGVPGAQPRAEVADALLDSLVLTVTGGDGGDRIEITLRQLSALARMGFLARDSYLGVDIAPRWIRLAATYGSVYAERKGLTLGALRPRTNPHGGVGG